MNELRFDVTDGTQAAWRFDPPGTPRAALVCLAGGTYDKHYWHLEVPGHDGYSFAEHAAAAGFCVIAVDHLGVGESADPAVRPVDLHLLARGDAQVAEQVRAIIGPDLPLVGVGHSMGACLATMVQAEAHSFDALALLGYGVDISNVGDGSRPADPPLEPAWIDIDRGVLRGLFHANDVPDVVIAADDAVASRVPSWCVSQVTTPGFVAPFAAAVEVPVFLGFGGALDTSADPWSEPQCYRSSPDITLHVLPGAAHCHNFASNRSLQWDRLLAWIAAMTTS